MPVRPAPAVTSATCPRSEDFSSISSAITLPPEAHLFLRLPLRRANHQKTFIGKQGNRKGHQNQPQGPAFLSAFRHLGAAALFGRRAEF